MERLSGEQLADAMHAVRSRAAGGVTHSNYFYAPLRGAECGALVGDGSLVFLDEEPEFVRVYFVSSDLDELSAQLASLTVRPLVADLVSRHPPDDADPAPPPEHAAFLRGGFAEIGHYQRMTARKIRARGARGAVLRATPERCDELLARLREDFDVRTERLPDRTELGEIVAAGQALVHLDEDDRIDGYVVYRMDGARCHLNYWHCRPGTHPAVALKLLADFFTDMAERGVPSVYLWVETRKTGPTRVYRSLGFRADGTRGRVLAKD